MSYPQTAAPTETVFNSNTTSHNVNMPATVSLGDLLLVILTTDGTATVTTPGGWSLLWTKNFLTGITTVGRQHGYAKVAAGSEGGTTVDFVTSANEAAAAQVYRVTDWNGTLAGVEVGSASQSTGAGGSTTPDPPSLTPSWSTDTLYFAVAGWSDDRTIDTIPTGYTNTVKTQNTVVDAAVATCRKEGPGAAEDPSAYSLTAAVIWAAQTIAVRGLGTPKSLIPLRRPLRSFTRRF